MVLFKNITIFFQEVTLLTCNFWGDDFHFCWTVLFQMDRRVVMRSSKTGNLSIGSILSSFCRGMASFCCVYHIFMHISSGLCQILQILHPAFRFLSVRVKSFYFTQMVSLMYFLSCTVLHCHQIRFHSTCFYVWSHSTQKAKLSNQRYSKDCNYELLRQTWAQLTWLSGTIVLVIISKLIIEMRGKNNCKI